MCGSFNPVTRAHLKMFDIAKNYLTSKSSNELKFIGIVSPVNDLYSVKRKNLSQSVHRIKMISLALEEANVDWIYCDDWESNQKNWQRTLHVLTYLSDKIKSNKNKDESIQVKLLSGADLIQSMNISDLWEDDDIETIVKDFGLVIIPRFNFQIKQFVDDHPILSKYKQNIIIIDDSEQNDCSSTKVR